MAGVAARAGTVAVAVAAGAGALPPREGAAGPGGAAGTAAGVAAGTVAGAAPAGQDGGWMAQHGAPASANGGSIRFSPITLDGNGSVPASGSYGQMRRVGAVSHRPLLATG